MNNSTKKNTEYLTSDLMNMELTSIQLSNNVKYIPTISIKASSILKYLVVSTIIVTILNLLVVICYQNQINFPARDKFYFDQENGLSAFFSSLLILISATIIGLIAIIKKKERDKFASHWLMLTIIFISLAADELASFHEFFITPLRDAFGLTGVFKFSWVIIGILVVVVFLFSYLKFFLSLSNNFKFWFFISGATYVIGVLGLEMAGGTLYIDDLNFRDQHLAYMLTMTVEEIMEMCGILLFIHTLLKYITNHTSKLKLSFN